MIACHAFCEPNAKQRFLGTLDAARGQSTRGPWRHLGEICKAQVSAVPDTRFMGAPYFALDRIARVLAADPRAAIEVPLPALTITGVGFELPPTPAAPPVADAGPTVITVDASGLLLGVLPIAKLVATGLAVSGDYPGAPIQPDRLAAAIADRPGAVAVLAPHALGAARVAEVIAAAGGHELRLAVAAPGPGGWMVPGTVPIALTAATDAGGLQVALGASPAAALAAIGAASADLERAPPTITVDASATVAGLAQLLESLAVRKVKAVAVIAAAAAAKP